MSRGVTNRLLDTQDRDEALRLVNAAAREAADADFAAVVAPDDFGELVVASADGAGASGIVGQRVPPESPAAHAINERTALIVDDLSARDDLTGPIVSMGLGPLVVVPLTARDQVLGALAIGNRPGGLQFTTDDVQMCGDFAIQAALVLMDSAAQAAAKELEMSQERARIARDLHDHVIQQIFGVGLRLNGLAARIGGSDGEAMMVMVNDLDEAIGAIRRSIFTLKMPTRSGDAVGLRSRLSHLLDQMTPALGFEPRLRTYGPVDSTVSSEIVADLLAVTREAMSNAARHANATEVDVVVRVADGHTTLEVHDNEVRCRQAGSRERPGQHAEPGGRTRGPL